MGILKDLKLERMKSSYYEITDKELRLLQTKLHHDSKFLRGWIKPTRWDKEVGDREVSTIDFYDAEVHLRRTTETIDRFQIVGRVAGLRAVNSDRNLPILIRAKKMNKYYDKVDGDTSLEEMKKIFGRLFYCIRIVMKKNGRNVLTVFDFVSNTKTKYDSWCDANGWYYNPRFGDKVLNWVESSFNEKYTLLCDDCFDREFIAYKDATYTKIGEKSFCPNCLRRRNYGVCDISGATGFRIKLKFSSKDDRKKVLKKLRIDKKGEINVLPEAFRDKGIRICDKCGSAFIGTDGYCKECKLTVVSSYGDKRYKFLKRADEKDEKMFFGTECEIEVNGNLDKCSKILNKNLSDMVYLKSDGSINHGFEIVSYAMTYKKWYSALRRFKEIFQEVIDKGGYSESASSTGLHIHLSRDGFKDKEHLARFARCFYLDKDLTKEIACREFNGYTQWNDFRASEDNYFQRRLSGLYDIFDDRYHIVNFRNEKTVEIRMFNGTLRADVIFAYLQFCKLLVDYSKINSVVSKDTMIKYLKTNAKSRVLRNLIKMYEFKQSFTLKEAKRCA